ncbi:hypothetical protein GCM10017688_20810 [Streptomyces ramulosus]
MNAASEVIAMVGPGRPMVSGGAVSAVTVAMVRLLKETGNGAAAGRGGRPKAGRRAGPGRRTTAREPES